MESAIDAFGRLIGRMRMRRRAESQLIENI
jgi:hypothetical protein